MQQSSNAFPALQQSLSMKAAASNYRSLSSLPMKNNFGLLSPPHTSITKDQTSFQPLTSPRQYLTFTSKKTAFGTKPRSEQQDQKRRCLPVELPSDQVTISKANSLVLRESEKLEEVLNAIAELFQGAEVNIAKATIRAKLEHGTEIKIGAVKVMLRPGEAKTVLEFNRLDGCVFTFQRAFIRAKLAAVEYLENMDRDKLKVELAQSEARLALWYDEEKEDASSSDTSMKLENNNSPALALGSQ